MPSYTSVEDQIQSSNTDNENLDNNSPRSSIIPLASLTFPPPQTATSIAVDANGALTTPTSATEHRNSVLLGKGGFGEVRKAILNGKEDVAVKLLRFKSGKMNEVRCEVCFNNSPN